MPRYHFVTHWRVRATAEEVTDVLGDPVGLTSWWPSVYLSVTLLEPGDPQTGIDRIVRLRTKGWLPYTLKWDFAVIESDPPNGFRIAAKGDFIGFGKWTFKEEGKFVDITYDWDIAVAKSLLVFGDFLFRPMFAANHRWAMARGLESLELKLRRRRGEAGVPDPPQPTFSRQ